MGPCDVLVGPRRPCPRPAQPGRAGTSCLAWDRKADAEPADPRGGDLSSARAGAARPRRSGTMPAIRGRSALVIHHLGHAETRPRNFGREGSPADPCPRRVHMAESLRTCRACGVPKPLDAFYMVGTRCARSDRSAATGPGTGNSTIAIEPLRRRSAPHWMGRPQSAEPARWARALDVRDGSAAGTRATSCSPARLRPGQTTPGRCLT